jgi:hypothetical protein
VAAARRWLARVWPGIALGGDGSGESGTVGVTAEPGEVFRSALAAIGALLLTSSATPEVGGGDSPSPLAGHPAGGAAAQSAPTRAPDTPDGGEIFYLIAIAGLLALLAFTVWRELRVALRPGFH